MRHATRKKPRKSGTHSSPSLIGSGRILQTAEVMRLLGYGDCTTFWQAARRAGLPHIRVSARKAVFRERDVERWMDSRTIGAALPQEAAV